MDENQKAGFEIKVDELIDITKASISKLKDDPKTFDGKQAAAVGNLEDQLNELIQFIKYVNALIFLIISIITGLKLLQKSKLV